MAPPPHSIEIEPPHEFYANLVGKNYATTTDSEPVLTPLNRPRRSPPVPSAAHVKPDQPTPETNQTEFTRVYQRALKHPPDSSSLSLSRSNKGFMMLEKMGWHEREGGLGRNRQGSMQPVKTVLKRDKKGVGLSKKKARITHSPLINQTVKTKKETKAEKRKRRQQQSEEESLSRKRARMLLRTDVSDEYEKMYLKLHSG